MKRSVSLFVLVVFFLLSFTADAGYGSKLRKHTKRGRIYSVENFDAKLVWNATFFSDEFREAYIEKHTKLHHMDEPIEISQFEAEQQYEQSQGWEFFVGAYMVKKYGHISTESDSFWKIYVTTESGERIKPVSIEMVPITPYEMKMFSYLTRWSKAYRLIFPKVDFGNRFTLTLKSVLGKSELKWKLKR